MKKLTLLLLVVGLFFAFGATAKATTQINIEDALITVNVLNSERIHLMQKSYKKVNKAERLSLFDAFSTVQVHIFESFDLPNKSKPKKIGTKKSRKVAVQVIKQFIDILNTQINILPDNGLQLNEQYEVPDSSLIANRIKIKRKFQKVLEVLDKS